MRLALLLLIFALPLSGADGPPSSRVGIPLTLTDVYIPGGDAKPKARVKLEPTTKDGS